MDLSRKPARPLAALLVIAAVASSLAWPSGALAQAPQPDKNGGPAPAATKSLSLQFGAATDPPGGGWVAERGRILAVEGAPRLQSDTSRRVVLVSPSGLPDTVRYAEQFVVVVEGTGLVRVRVQGRRDPRGGWIPLAEGTAGKSLHEGPDGFTIRRAAGARGAPIKRLRIELEFRTTNPRTLRRIAAVAAPSAAKVSR